MGGEVEKKKKKMKRRRVKEEENLKQATELSRSKRLLFPALLFVFERALLFGYTSLTEPAFSFARRHADSDADPNQNKNVSYTDQFQLEMIELKGFGYYQWYQSSHSSQPIIGVPSS